MTESVIITGRDLDIEHRADDEPKSDPKRKRPPRFDPSPVPSDYRTVQQITEAGNPYLEGRSKRLGCRRLPMAQTPNRGDMKRWRVRWHRHKIMGRKICWYWGHHGNPNGSYGWRWFRRDRHVRPTNWRANFGPLHISLWGKRRPKATYGGDGS